MATDGPLGVCLVGSGRIGQVHAQNVIANTRLQLKYVVDVDEKSASTWASRVAGCKALKTIDEALQDPSVKGVVICTPTAQHREIILASVRAGKAIMCEKPISLHINEIDECYNEAKKTQCSSFVWLSKTIRS
jgi:myo-inositol 2-dehydrogenase/D-chiro-inositol 1-dehydrogenase